MTGTVKNEGALQLLLMESLARNSVDLELFWNRTGPLSLMV